jgi:anaerobic magnesium-protoporphyrin IX monomethyl ester cyclase
MLYVTPHRWTPFFNAAAKRKVIQSDMCKWDYKHQVLATRHVPAWRVLFWVKLIEAVMQLRPRSLWRLFAHPDRAIRAAMRWYYRIGRKVWFYEIWNFLFRDHLQKYGPALEEFWGIPQNGEQNSLLCSYQPTSTTNSVISSYRSASPCPPTGEAARSCLQ